MYRLQVDAVVQALLHEKLDRGTNFRDKERVHQGLRRQRQSIGDETRTE